ncbi:MAG: pyrimidine dimer DNA glycosylase/endonuclease V, partial [Fusobacteriaceae bacterium]
MNIFILHNNAEENAKLYCNSHVVKMILESVQILCSVSHMKGIPAPYKLTHENHPCTKWVAQSEAHWDMLVNIVEALNNEYKYRYDKDINHKSYDVMRGLEKPKFDRVTPTGKFVAVVEEI